MTSGGEKPKDSEDYFYTIWKINFELENDLQPVNTIIDPQVTPGEAIARLDKYGGKYKIVGQAKDGKIEIGPSYYPEEKKEVFILCRHRKDSLKDNPDLTITNVDKVTIEGVDTDYEYNSHDDITVSHQYKYEPPKKMEESHYIDRFFKYVGVGEDISYDQNASYNKNAFVGDGFVDVTYYLSAWYDSFDREQGPGFKLDFIDEGPLSINDSEKLTPLEEYYFTSIKPRAVLYEIVDTPEGEKKELLGTVEDIGRAQIYYKNDVNGDWLKFKDVKLSSKDSWLQFDGTDKPIDIDGKPVSVKVELTLTRGTFMSGGMDIGAKIIASDRIKELLDTDGSVKITNEATTSLSKLDGSDKRTAKNKANLNIQGPQFEAYLMKNSEIIGNLDLTNHTAKIDYSVVAKFTETTGKATSADWKIFDGAAFYDLLPKGITEKNVKNIRLGVAPETFNNMNPSYYDWDMERNRYNALEDFSYTTEFIDNWNNTGQTMMKIYVNTSGGQEEVKDKLSIIVRYSLIVTFDQIEELDSKLNNKVAFSPNSTSGIKRGKADPSSEKFPARDRDEYGDFSNISNEGQEDVENKFFTEKTQSIPLPKASELSYVKSVGTQKEVFKSSIEINEGEEYEYKLRLKTPEKTRAKNLIFYDVLENDHGNNPYWQGKFKEITEGNSGDYDVAPKYYYSTKDNIHIYNEDGTLTEQGSLDNKEVWTDVKPESDKITAIAIDLRKTKDGNDFIMPDDSFLYLTIKMEGIPKNYSEYSDYVANKDNKNKPIKAYNTTILQSTLIDELGNKTTNARRANTTKVSIKTTELKVYKKWDNLPGKNLDDIEQVEVQLYRNDEAVDGKTLTLNKDNGWSDSFIGLPTLDLANNKNYEYTAKEVGEDNGVVKINNRTFEVSYENDSSKNSTLITNKETIQPTPLDPPKTDIKVEKIWQDKDGKEISAPLDKIEVELYRDGQATDKKLTLNAENNWTGEFKDLDVVEKVDSEKAYEYTVKEVGEKEGNIKLSDSKYKVSYDGSMEKGFKITNKLEETSSPWTPITPPKEDIKVEKIWQGKDGKEISAPVDKIEVELYRDGEKTDKKLELNKSNNWSGEFKDLDVQASLNAKEAYKYTIKEVGEKDNKLTIDDSKYQVTYGGTEEKGFKITNKLEETSNPWTPITPSKEDIKVEKIWQGKDGKEITAPVDKIEVELYRGGKATGEKKELSKENSWKAEFKDLDVVEKLDSEKAYEYTVKEVGEEKGKVVIGNNKYEVKYSGSMNDGFTITNEEEPTIPPTPLDPPKEDIKVKKNWQDKDGKEISAPVDKIEVELYRDGKSTGKKLELNKANNWSGEFKDLDVVEKLDSKEGFKYSVKEVGEETGSIKLNGNWYKVNYSGSMKDSFTITNKEEPKTPPTPPTPSEPDTITIEVKKDWTLYGNKPVDKIMVELYRDGKATGKILELNKANNWSGEFKNLDVKKGANSTHDYHYTVKEVGESGNTIKLDGRWFDVNYLGNMKDGFTIVNKEEKPTEPGKPEEPNTPNKPNDPQEPNTPETPKEPEKPNNPGTPVKPNTPKTPLPGKQLPKTGNGLNPSTYAWILLGLGNLSTFAGIQRKKRIKSRRKKNVK
ncbi:Cna B-type domain-containing protein [Peptoniphilus rhinitidis]|uniref:Cna B-type domain-containing protein n=1 Tax=Peptoniphilus rhinitidis TaxID=1175452 RepID=UPI0002895A06|nr:Cna B-type domain-containing protein [Peptoniphilus rhinitidis]